MKVKSRNTSLASNAARLALALLVFSTSFSSIAQTDRLGLPDMGASADSILSRKEEEEYAKALVRQMRSYEVLNEDPLINAYFKDMGYRLVANSDRPDKSFTFVIVDMDVVNAFAAPGGVIALYSGLILAADDENEVAGVVAHEIAHVTQQHLFRAIENAQSISIPLMLAMVGLILVGGGSGDAIQGALLGGQAAMQQAMINYTRQNEAEADRIGIQTLAKSGYDPRGMGEFFEKMNRITRAMGEGPPEYLRTHPVTVSRIAEADSRAQNMPIPPASDGLNFYLAQARLRALVEDYPSKALEQFEYMKQRADMNQAHSDALDYGIAIALQRQGKYQQARTLLLNLMDRGEHLAYEIQLADLDLASGHTAAALDRLAGLYHSFPGNNAISMEYSEALLHSGDKSQAETAAVILRQQILNHDDDPALYALYARASNEAGETIRAKEAIAESYYLRGGVHEAVLQLQELVKRNDLDYYERARVTARLNEYQIELAKMGLDERHIPR